MSKVYIKSIFDVLEESELRKNIVDYDTKGEELRKLFAEMPQRATEFSAGYDLGCLTDLVIPAHESKQVQFGNFISVKDPTCVAVVVPRSSLAKKRGLILAGGPYLIHFENTKSILSCRFINFTDEDVELKAGDKIAQVVFIKYPEWLCGESIKNLLGDDFYKVTLSLDPFSDAAASPMLKNNIEFIGEWNSPGATPKVDQEEMDTFYFQSPFDEIVLTPGKVTCVMTGLRVHIGKGEVFILKSCVNAPCVELANTVGVIDADYYDNPDNGGEIGVLLLNRGARPVHIKSGDVIAEGSIYFYEKAEGDTYGGKRTGGFGSTDAR